MNTRTDEERRHYVHETIIRKALNGGIRKARPIKRAACHTLQYSFAAQLLESGYDIETMKELLGHKDVRTTPTFRTGTARVLWTICRGDMTVSCIENTYHPATLAEGSPILCGYRGYERKTAGVLCPDLASQRCNEEIIQPLLGYIRIFA